MFNSIVAVMLHFCLSVLTEFYLVHLVSFSLSVQGQAIYSLLFK